MIRNFIIAMVQKTEPIPEHPHSWWQSTEVQAALIGGLCLIVASAIGAWIKSRNRKRRRIIHAQTMEKH